MAEHHETEDRARAQDGKLSSSKAHVDSEQSYDYWTIPSKEIPQLTNYVNALNDLRGEEQRLLMRVVAIAALAASAGVWLSADSEVDLPVLWASRGLFFLPVVWLLFWFAITVLRLNPQTLTLRGEAIRGRLYHSKDQNPCFRTSAEWEQELRSVLSGLQGRLNYADTSFRLGLSGAIILTLASFSGLLSSLIQNWTNQ